MEQFKNTFEGGLETELGDLLKEPKTYKDGLNVTLSEDNNLGFVAKMKGATKETVIVPSAAILNNVRVLEVFPDVVFQDNSGASPVPTEGFCVFATWQQAASNWTFGVYFIDSITFTSTNVYSESVDQDFYNNASVNGYSFFENGYDTIYYTDGINPPRKISGRDYTTVLEDEDVFLVKPYPRNQIDSYSITSSSSDGGLDAGSYQFSFRLYKPENRQYTKWSLLTVPYSVFNREEASNTTGKLQGLVPVKLDFDIAVTSDERAYYDYIEVAAVYNGSDDLATTATACVLLPITGLTNNFTFEGSTLANTVIDLSEITIDQAPIDNVKTMSQKDNRSIIGNINLVDLDYDNGDPVVNSNSGIELLPTDVEPSDDTNDYSVLDNTTKVGHYKGEVYRYAVTYHDEWGNWSRPKVLDLSASTTNQASAGIDFKFPRRDFKGMSGSTYYGIGKTSVLKLFGLANHPSWAKGFAILRAKRIKDIIFQTPVIPARFVQPPAAVGDYPPTGETLGNQNGSWFPKVFGWGGVRDIVRASNDKTTGTVTAVEDECYYGFNTPEADGDRNVSFIFPPEYLYNNGIGSTVEVPEDISSYKLDVVDVACLTPVIRNFGSGLPALGSFVGYAEYEISYEARPSDQGYYYSYNTNNALSTIFTEVAQAGFNSSVEIPIYNPITIVSSASVSANGEGSTLPKANITTNICDYSGVKDSLNEGSPQVNTPIWAIATDVNVGDPTYQLTTEATPADYNFVYGENATNCFGDLLTTWRGGFSSNATTALVKANMDGSDTDQAELSLPQAVLIANVCKGLADDRYGLADDYHEFIYTGAYYSLSDSDVSTNNPIDVDVWGGDCFISNHYFKPGVSSHGLVDPDAGETQAQSEKRWENWLPNTSGGSDNTKRPYLLRSYNQNIGVYLESEVNASAANKTEYDFLPITPVGDPHKSIYTSKSGVSLPFSYLYNLGYSSTNDKKIFVIDRTFNLSSSHNTSSSVPNRIYFSNLKINGEFEESFSTYPILNFYDIDGSHGEINRLINNNDEIYCFQASGISLIPVSEQIIQTSGGTDLSINTGSIITDPRYITTEHGISNPQGVNRGKNILIFKDNFGIAGLISGMEMQDISTNRVRSKSIGDIICFDEYRNEVWFLRNDLQNAFVYNLDLNVWGSQVREEQGSNYDFHRFFTNGDDFLLFASDYDNADELSLYSMYTGDYSTLVSSLQNYESKVEFIANPNPEVAKVFDASIISATNTLGSIKYTIDNDAWDNEGVTSGDESLTSVDQVEGTYRVKSLRDAADERRLRGLYATIEVVFSNVESKLRSVVSLFRNSKSGI